MLLIKKFIQGFAWLTSHGNLPRFRGMPELPVVAFCGEKESAVGLEHLNDFLYFVTFH